jgi:hypothetical protein
MTTSTLTDAALLGAAGDVVFARGEDYTRYVRGLVVNGSRAKATVQAKRVYEVELSWTTRELEGYCTCPHFAQGWFCKHLVAVGLVVVDEHLGGRTTLATALDELEASDPVPAYLESLDAPALRSLVLQLAEHEPAAGTLELLAAMHTGHDEDAQQALKSAAQDALRARGYVDYRRSFEAAARAQLMLNELAAHLDAGRADLVQPALLYSVTRLRALIMNADDSAGVLGDACQQAADLYARSCREGSPDQAKLGRWLVKFRADSPGWPDVTLGPFASALGTKGLAAYRKGVLALDAKAPRTDRAYDRFEIDRMLLELADHDGDVDGAIAILTSGEHTKIAAIISRLTAAGRDDEVLPWIDRAVADKRISDRMGGGGDYWLSPDEVADAYLAADRVDDAFDVLRASLLREPGNRSFARLLTYAEQLGRHAGERQWALDALRQRAAADHYSGGAVLVEIALAEGDPDAAWEAADEFGAGHAWEQLAKATASTHPSRCAALYRGSVDKELRHANTAAYAKVAATLVTMRRLSAAADEDAEFAEYLAGIREGYRRRPSLMAALDRAGL